MRNFTIFLTLLLLSVVGGVRAEVITTTPQPGVNYKITCIATAHSGYLGDDGNTLQGRHATGTVFILEATGVDGQYYLKSLETGKYVNAAGVTSGSAITFDMTPTTYWRLDQTNADVSKNSWAVTFGSSTNILIFRGANIFRFQVRRQISSRWLLVSAIMTTGMS